MKEAKKLQVVAEQAKNTSLEAYNLAKKAIAKYTNIRYLFCITCTYENSNCQKLKALRYNTCVSRYLQ